MELREYQERFVENIARSLKDNRRIIAQLATGGGKTVTFSAIAKRFNEKSKQRVLILVHRMELLNQAVKTIERNTGLKAVGIVAGMKSIPDAQVYVAMVETTHRRLDKLPDFGLIIIDEAHIGNFTKLIEHFNDKFIIGFTATPIASKKDKPLKNYFKDIVCGVSIGELINDGHLCKAYTFGVEQEIDRAKLKMVKGDFDIQQMAMMMSANKYIESVVNNYAKLAINQKTLIFNCNVEHSKIVTKAFTDRNYNARHLDGEMTVQQREEIMKWFNDTPDAILCNIGIATTGFDQPDIKCIIVNRATASMPLWLQMCGRGSRPSNGKHFFTIIDFGGNTTTHGDWQDDRDWNYLFHNPAKKGNGVAPMKKCPKCSGYVHTRIMVCPMPSPVQTIDLFSDSYSDLTCGYKWEVKEITELEPAEIVSLTKGVDVQHFIDFVQNEGSKEYRGLFMSLDKYIYIAASKSIPLNTAKREVIISGCEKLAREWSQKVGHKTARAALFVARKHTEKELIKLL
jgi:superfamily II DNA or RNA helicase